MKKKKLAVAGAIIIFFLALGLTFYPIISNAYNVRHQSKIHTAYVEVVEEANNTELLTAREQAIAYNESIVPGSVDGKCVQSGSADGSVREL